MNFATIENFLRQIPLLAPLVDFEQRLHQRYPTANTEVMANGTGEGAQLTGILKDISKSGLAFLSAACISQEAIVLDILFQGARISDSIPCKVVWRKETKTRETKYGVQFEELSPEQARQLDEFIQTHTIKFFHKHVYGLPSY